MARRRIWLAAAAFIALGAAAVGAFRWMQGEESVEAESVYRARMRDLVQEISARAKAARPGFLVIPQNGEALLTANGDPAGQVNEPYLDAIDGLGREDVFCGEQGYDRETPANVTREIAALLDVARGRRLPVLAIDYCSTRALVDRAMANARKRGYLSFVASTGNNHLDAIPSYPARPPDENARDILSLADARNFLYLINPGRFESRGQLIRALGATSHDALVVDAFFDVDDPLLPADVEGLKRKANGGRRLVLAYMNVGSAERFRYYWRPEWSIGSPAWLAFPYEGYPDEAYVRYWDPEWRAIMYNDPGSYLARVLEAGFDGVYLDNVLAYEVFESRRG